MSELPNAGHELEARRWARLLRGPRSLCFAVGSAGIEPVVARCRELAPATTIEVLRAEPASVWRQAQMALTQLPPGGALVLELAHASGQASWSARDWQALNLARDAPERAGRHVLVWIPALDGVDALRDGAPDLWMHRSLLLMFPSAADFMVPTPSGPTVEEALRRELQGAAAPDPITLLQLLAELAWDSATGEAWTPVFARLVSATWQLSSDEKISWLECLALQSGGWPLLREARRCMPVAEFSAAVDGLRSFKSLARSEWAGAARGGVENNLGNLLTGRPSRVAALLGERKGATDTPHASRVLGHANALRAEACLDQLLALDAIRWGVRSVQHRTAVGLFGGTGMTSAVVAYAFASLGLLAESRVVLDAASASPDPWQPWLCWSAIDIREAPVLRVRALRRALAPEEPRTAGRERLLAAHLLRRLGTREDRCQALELLDVVVAPAARVRFLASDIALHALPVDGGLVETVLAQIAHGTGETPAPGFEQLDLLTYDPLADLRLAALQLRAALLRELDRPKEALIAIEALLATPDRRASDVAESELEAARIHAALGDTPSALRHLDRLDAVLEGERDGTLDVRPIRTLVGAAVVRARLIGDPTPIHDAIALCESEENRALVFELHLELAAMPNLGIEARRGAARAALLLASETGFIVLEARAAAWAARLGADGADALRARAEWIAARCPDRRLALAMAGERVPEP